MTPNQFRAMAFKRWALSILSLEGEAKTERIKEFVSWMHTWVKYDKRFNTTPFAICEQYRNSREVSQLTIF